jgi:general secretion pathway protein B
VSFILDALKKSENERQRQAGPSLADVRISRSETERPWWAVAVAALLVVNLGVLLVVLMRNDGREESSPAASPSAPFAASSPASSALPASRVPASPPMQQSSNPAVHPLADEAVDRREPPVDPAITANAALAAAANVPEGPPLVKPVEPPGVAPTATPAPPAFDARNGPASEVLPTSIDLAASGRSVPELHLDIHVYSANPAERFVLVNMRRYTEGQALNEGPTVERITTDGVVLNHRGLRYVLPRQ